LHNVKQSRVAAAALLIGALTAALASASQAQVAAGAAVGWGETWYAPLAPYRYGGFGYGWSGAWASCGAAACVDDPYLRRAIRREIDQQEHLRELEERARRGFAPTAPLYDARRDWPPPTPEAQVQPAYRGSGEVLPQFSGSGQPRQDFAAPAR
jgi:hypothetical protein